MTIITRFKLEYNEEGNPNKCVNLLMEIPNIMIKYIKFCILFILFYVSLPSLSLAKKKINESR